MRGHIWKRPSVWIPTVMALVLFVAMACGSAPAEPIVIEKEVIKEIIKEVPVVKEVIKEVPKEVIVEKEVVREVVKEVFVIPTSTPRPVTKGDIPGEGESPVRGGIVNMQAFEPPGSDTYYGGSNADNTLLHIGAVFHQIVEFDPDTREGLDLRGGVAESWEITDGGLTYTFKLRKDMKFHDGTPLEMKDVLHTLTTAFTPDELEFPEVVEELQGRTLGDAQRVQTYLKDWEATDDETLTMHLNFPSNAFLITFGYYRFPVISEDAIAEHGTFKVPNEVTLVGTGPYKFVEYDKDIVTELERNPDYHIKGRPYLDGVRQYVIIDIGTIIAAFKTEQVLMSGNYVSNLNIADLVKLQEEMGEEKLRLIATSVPDNPRGVMMNTKKPPFDNPKARKAMNLVVHRQPVIQTITAGRGFMGTPIPCGFGWSFTCEDALNMPGMRELNGEKHPDDIAEAQKLMLDAGFGPGTEVQFTCRLVVEYCDIMMILQSQLEKYLGWKITTRSLESTAGYDEYRAGNFQMAVQAVGFPFPDPDASAAAYRKGSTSHTQRTFFYNEAAEPLWALINTTTDFEARRDAVNKVNDLLMEDHSWANVYFSVRAWPVNKRIKNFIDPAGRGAYIQWDQIWCDTC